MKKMIHDIRWGVRMIAFAAGFAALLLLSSYIFRPKDNTSAAGMDVVSQSRILGEPKNSIDVVVVGDSESYSAISPLQIWKETGYTSYVCGTSGQMLDCSLRMVEQAFTCQRPKIIILETNAIYRKMSMSNRVITKLGHIFSIFYDHDRWKSLNWKDFLGTVEYTKTDDYKGYRYNVNVNASHAEDYMAPKEKIREVAELNLQYVKDIKRLCDEYEAELILLSTPSTKNWNYMKHNGIVNLAETLGCEYVDLNLLNDVLQIDWEQDTRDRGDHMNFFGATKVSRYLAGYLQEKGQLECHWEDAEYERWHEALEHYERSVVDEMQENPQSCVLGA